jgi:zeta-carotene desaturase
VIKLRNEAEKTYDAVIFAIPPFAFKKINFSFAIPDLDNFESSPIVSLYLWSEEDFMDDDFYALIGTNFQWIFKETSKSLRYTLTYSAADEIASLAKNEIFEIAFKDLEQTFPKFNRSAIYHSQIIAEKSATIKLTTLSQKLRPYQKISKGIYLAGDWTNTALPATMESAALSGKLAAQNLIIDYSL